MKKKCFTLAEVLVTLSILGVVAGITIPNIINNYQQRQTVTAVKRAWSILDNALQQMYIIDGQPYTWNWPNGGSDKEQNFNFFAEKLSKYLSIQKFCNTDYGCMLLDNPMIYTDGGGNEYHIYRGFTDESIGRQGISRPGLILKNGMYVMFDKYNIYPAGGGPDKLYAIFIVDINGKKGPNRVGYDVFYFDFGESGILTSVPKTNSGGVYGVANNAGALFYSRYCNKYYVGENIYDGRACSTWIMRHNNMDYLKKNISSYW